VYDIDDFMSHVRLLYGMLMASARTMLLQKVFMAPA
jgi:hypothetical protein